MGSRGKKKGNGTGLERGRVQGNILLKKEVLNRRTHDMTDTCCPEVTLTSCCFQQLMWMTVVEGRVTEETHTLWLQNMNTTVCLKIANTNLRMRKENVKVLINYLNGLFK